MDINLTKEKEQEINQQVGASIRKFRSEVGLTQTQAAEFINVTFQQFQKYERGTNRLSLPKAHILATRFGVSVDDF